MHQFSLWICGRAQPRGTTARRGEPITSATTGAPMPDHDPLQGQLADALRRLAETTQMLYDARADLADARRRIVAMQDQVAELRGLLAMAGRTP